MTRVPAVVSLGVALLLCGVRPAAGDQTPDAGIVAAIHVRGNTLTPTEDIVGASGVTVGDVFAPDLPARVETRLRATGRFEGVDVRARFASIADPSRIALVIVVDERPVRVLPAPADRDEQPRVLRRGWLRSMMLMPLVSGEDGYGVTYGGAVAWPGVLGRRSRLTIPLTWGGHRRAGVEVERRLAGAQRIRLTAGGSVEQRRNPFYREDDARRRVWGRAERAAGRLRPGATIGWQRVRFAGDDDRLRSIGLDATFDTRLDAGWPRNAVVVTAAWTGYRAADGRRFDIRAFEARGYLGLLRQSVLEARVDLLRAGPGAPRALRPLLGGWSTVRGYRAAAFAGDTRALGSLELRLPLSNVLTAVRTGVSVFVDAGRAWDHGMSFDATPVRTGYGAGLWLRGPLVHAGVSVANGRGSGIRVHVGGGIGSP